MFVFLSLSLSPSRSLRVWSDSSHRTLAHQSASSQAHTTPTNKKLRKETFFLSYKHYRTEYKYFSIFNIDCSAFVVAFLPDGMDITNGEHRYHMYGEKHSLVIIIMRYCCYLALSPRHILCIVCLYRFLFMNQKAMDTRAIRSRRKTYKWRTKQKRETENGKVEREIRQISLSTLIFVTNGNFCHPHNANLLTVLTMMVLTKSHIIHK